MTAQDSIRHTAPVMAFSREGASETHEGLLAAAAEVFNERGYTEVKNQEIAKRAGVSVATFYRYFGCKRDIFDYVQRRWLSKAFEEVMSTLNPAGLQGEGRQQLIADCLRVLFDHAESHPTLQRVFYEVSVTDSDLAEVRRRFEAEAHQQITGLIRMVTTRERVPDPEATAHVLQSAAIDLAMRLTSDKAHMPISRERAIDALSALVAQALF